MNRATRQNLILAASRTEFPAQALPNALYTTKKLFKNPPIEKCLPFGNMMHDRRIVRGTAFKHATPSPSHTQHKPVKTHRKPERTKIFRFRIGTPPMLFNRKDEPCQTENYLTELYEHPPEKNVSCQTDLFLDRPDSPPYIPAKTGIDTETQIYKGELFDFDLECQVVVDVIVSKTLEQAMIEVLEGDEILALQAAQLRYLELRGGEKSEVQRLEEQEKRLREEKDRRMEQFRKACHLQREVEDRVAAAVLTHGYLGDFLPNILEELRAAGFLLDNIRDDVEKGVLPWQWNELGKKAAQKQCARDVLTEIVEDISTARRLVYQLLGDQEDAVPKPRRTCAILGGESEEEFVLGEGEEIMIVNQGGGWKVDVRHGGQDVPLVVLEREESGTDAIVESPHTSIEESVV